MDKNEALFLTHRPVRAEEARFFAPSRSISTRFLSCWMLRDGVTTPPQHERISAYKAFFYFLSITHVTYCISNSTMRIINHFQLMMNYFDITGSAIIGV